MAQRGVDLVAVGAEGELVTHPQLTHGLARDQHVVQLYRQTRPVREVAQHPCDRRPHRHAKPLVASTVYIRWLPAPPAYDDRDAASPSLLALPFRGRCGHSDLPSNFAACLLSRIIQQQNNKVNAMSWIFLDFGNEKRGRGNP